VSQLDATVMVY